MADDRKRDEVLCTKVTEQMLLDLNRHAAREERTLSDFMFRMIRRQLYGLQGTPLLDNAVNEVNRE